MDVQNLWMLEQRPEPRWTLSPDVAVVSRLVAIGSDRLAALLRDAAGTDGLGAVDLGSGGRLVLTRRLAPERPALGSTAGEEPVEWSGEGRLRSGGRALGRSTRVHVWISQWSHDAFEVRIRPVGRRPLSWGARRVRRYFELAHRAADALAAALVTREDGGPGSATGGSTSTAVR